jgi:hypothetical protein
MCLTLLQHFTFIEMSLYLTSFVNGIPSIMFWGGVFVTTVFGANVIIDSYKRVSRKERQKSLIDQSVCKRSHQSSVELDLCNPCVTRMAARKELAAMDHYAPKDLRDVYYVAAGTIVILSSYVMSDIKTALKL